jgi:hypothetical protein
LNGHVDARHVHIVQGSARVLFKVACQLHEQQPGLIQKPDVKRDVTMGTKVPGDLLCSATLRWIIDSLSASSNASYHPLRLKETAGGEADGGHTRSNASLVRTGENGACTLATGMHA